MQVRQANISFTVLSKNPTIAIAQDVLTENEIHEVVTNLSDRHWLAGQRIPVQMDRTGTSFELLETVHTPLWKVHQRIRETLKMESASVASIRIRDYKKLDSHKAHCDHFSIDNKFLLFSAILYLNTAERGGETHFSSAEKPISIKAERNSLAFWINYNDDGSEDLNTLHESLEVKEGKKLVAIFLFYGDKSELASVRESLTKAE